LHRKLKSKLGFQFLQRKNIPAALEVLKVLEALC